MSLSSVSSFCLFCRVLVFRVFLVFSVVSLSSVSSLSFLRKKQKTRILRENKVVSEGKAQGDKRKTRFLRKKGASSEGNPAHTLQQHAYSRQPTAAAPTLQQQAPVDLYYPSRVSPMHHDIVSLNRCSPTSTSSFVKLPIHNCAAGDPALEFMIKYATKQEQRRMPRSRNEVSRSCISGVPLRAVVTGLWTSHPDSPV